MRPGPAKRFDPDQALAQARDLFWSRGYDGTGISDLEAALGIGRKSLYDTFESKHALYLRALEHYGSTVIVGIIAGLERPDSTALANLERVLNKLAQHHGSGQSLGCLLGVGMAQAARTDVELVELLRHWLAQLERGFEGCVRRGMDEGSLREELRPRDVASQLVALVQGLALMGRIAPQASAMRAAVRAALDGLRKPSSAAAASAALKKATR